jgi:hypothetical protein
MTVDETQKIGECLNCARLRDEIARLAVDRQRLIELLASERERANALFVSYPPQGPGTVSWPPMPASAALPVSWHAAWLPSQSDKPLRYKVADSLNDAVKNNLPTAHGLAKRALAALRGKRKRG